MQNILALQGPAFLNIFGVVAICVLAGAWLGIRFADDTDRRPPLAPQNPDAIEVAYLQGGVNQVIRTVVYDLVQRGYAALEKDDRIVPTGEEPTHRKLNAIEQRIYDSLQAKPKAHELFANRTQRAKLM